MVALLAVAGAVGAYALAALALPGLAQWADGVAGRDMLERLRTAESTCGSRLILWRNVLYLIGQKPWTGWGWGELDYGKMRENGVRSRFQTSFVIWARTCPRSSVRGEASSYRGRARSCCAV